MKIHLRLLLTSLVMIGLVVLSSHRGSAAEIVYESTGHRDPFVPLIGPGGVILRSFDPSGYQVEGIIYDQIDGSLALINGEFYKEGEKVKTATVKKPYSGSSMPKVEVA